MQGMSIERMRKHHKTIDSMEMEFLATNQKFVAYLLSMARKELESIAANSKEILTSK